MPIKRLIKPEEVFDYVYYKADDTQEGNETGRLMQQQAAELEALWGPCDRPAQGPIEPIEPR